MSRSDSEAANQPHAGNMRKLNAPFHLPSAPSALPPSNVLNRRAHRYHPPPAIAPRFPSLNSAFTSRKPTQHSTPDAKAGQSPPELTVHAKQHLSLLTSTPLQSEVDLDQSQRAKQKRKKAVKGFMQREKNGLCKSWLPVKEEGAVHGRVATEEGAPRMECLDQDKVTPRFAAVLTFPVGKHVILDPSTRGPSVSSRLDGTSLTSAALAKTALASASSSAALGSAAAAIPLAHTAKNIDTVDRILMPGSSHHCVWIDQVPAPCPASELTKSLNSAHLFCARLTMQMVSKLGVSLCWVQTGPGRDFFVDTALPTHARKDLPFDWDRTLEVMDQFWKWEGEKHEETFLDVDGYEWYLLTVGASALFLHYNIVDVQDKITHEVALEETARCAITVKELVGSEEFAKKKLFEHQSSKKEKRPLHALFACQEQWPAGVNFGGEGVVCSFRCLRGKEIAKGKAFEVDKMSPLLRRLAADWLLQSLSENRLRLYKPQAGGKQAPSIVGDLASVMAKGRLNFLAQYKDAEAKGQL
ncbi:uncharacterized protein JCM10292_003477 [Rhodotorula paludigena]|uniref:uncharacterized protein n=1 Tax=Rhodotorula paludigena TaxID=86838 RepID=UPI00317BFE0C